jgi:hypothetical protein
MKCKINEKEAKTRIPEIGEPWKHRNDGRVFMRMRDDDGHSLLRDADPVDYFFSVELTSLEIFKTRRSSTTIIILQPKGGEIIFEEKTSGD